MQFEPSDQKTLEAVAEFARGITSHPAPHVTTRLKGGRTNAVFLARCQGTSGAFVIKVSHQKEATLLFENRPTDEWEVMTALSQTGQVPLPLALRQLAEGIWLLAYQFLPGHEGARSADALASVLRRVHRQTCGLKLPKRPVTPEELMAEADRFAVGGLPDRALALRPSTSGATPPEAPCLVHRDPIASNIVTDVRGASVLIDWQCPAFGDPLEDIAHATSPAMAHVYGSAVPYDAEDVLAWYGDKALRERARRMLPIYRWRMLCYCAWQAARGNAAYAEGMEKEADALEKLRS